MTAIRLVTELPGPRSRALMAERNREVARGPFHTTPLFVERGEGALVDQGGTFPSPLARQSRASLPPPRAGRANFRTCP